MSGSGRLLLSRTIFLLQVGEDGSLSPDLRNLRDLHYRDIHTHTKLLTDIMVKDLFIVLIMHKMSVKSRCE